MKRLINLKRELTNRKYLNMLIANVNLKDALIANVNWKDALAKNIKINGLLISVDIIKKMCKFETEINENWFVDGNFSEESDFI